MQDEIHKNSLPIIPLIGSILVCVLFILYYPTFRFGMFEAAWLTISLNMIVWGIFRHYESKQPKESRKVGKKHQVYLKIIISVYIIGSSLSTILPNLDFISSFIRIIPIFPIYLLLIIASIFNLDVLFFIAIIVGISSTLICWRWFINRFVFKINNVTKNENIYVEMHQFDTLVQNETKQLGFIHKIMLLIMNNFKLCLILLFIISYLSKFLLFLNNLPGNDISFYLYYSKLIYLGDWGSYFNQPSIINMIGYLPTSIVIALFMFIFNGNVIAVLTYIIPLFSSILMILLAKITLTYLKSKILSIMVSVLYLLTIWQTHMAIENYAQLLSLIFSVSCILLIKSNKEKQNILKVISIGICVVLAGIYYFALMLIIFLFYNLFIQQDILPKIHAWLRQKMPFLNNSYRLTLSYLFIIVLILIIYFVILDSDLIQLTILDDIYAYFYNFFLKDFSLFHTQSVYEIMVNELPFFIIGIIGLYTYFKYFRTNVVYTIIILIIIIFAGLEFFGLLSTHSFVSPRFLFYLEFALIPFSGVFLVKYWNKVLLSKEFPKKIKKFYPFIVLLPFIIGSISIIPTNYSSNFNQESINMLNWLINYDSSLINSDRTDSIIVTNYKSENWINLFAGQQVFSTLTYRRSFIGLYNTLDNNETLIREDLLSVATDRIYFFYNNVSIPYWGQYQIKETQDLLDLFELNGEIYSIIYNEIDNIIIQIQIA